MPDSSQPNIFTDASSEQIAMDDLLQEGDCGIIVRPDGSFRLISSGLDIAKLAGDPANYTEKEIEQIAMGEKLMAISVALTNDAVMSILLDLSKNLVDPEKVRRALTRH